MKRKSSRGNPWHDANGRFCHGPEASVDTWGNPISEEQRQEAVKKSEKEVNDYEQRSKIRRLEIAQSREEEKKLIKSYIDSSKTNDYENFDKQSKEFIEKYGQKEYEKVKERAIKVNGETPNEFQSMPWETDPMYKNEKNAKLVWLSNHPEHKYNNTDLNWDIKRIQTMSDNNVSVEIRRKLFEKMIKEHNLNENEAICLLGKEFLA